MTPPLLATTVAIGRASMFWTSRAPATPPRNRPIYVIGHATPEDGTVSRCLQAPLAMIANAAIRSGHRPGPSGLPM
jgi:hypothetical protein